MPTPFLAQSLFNLRHLLDHPLGGMNPTGRMARSFGGEATAFSQYLSVFPLFQWKSIAARLWEGRLRPKVDHNPQSSDLWVRFNKNR